MGSKTLLCLLVPFFLFACKSIPKHELSEAEKLQAKKLIAAIADFNLSSPVTLSSAFTAQGSKGGKEFKVAGNAAFDKKGYYKITVLDYIFQSPVIEAHRELDTLYFYYPAEKRLYIDNARKIDINRYTGFRGDYALLYNFLTGTIPLIDGYNVNKCLYKDKERVYDLVLENSDFYQTISFRDNLPERIEFTHKLTGSKGGINLSSPLKKGKTVFYRKYSVVIPAYEIDIAVNFTRPVLNGDVNLKKIDPDRMPPKTEVIRVN